jgi:hypothetical protein
MACALFALAHLQAILEARRQGVVRVVIPAKFEVPDALPLALRTHQLSLGAFS